MAKPTPRKGFFKQLIARGSKKLVTVSRNSRFRRSYVVSAGALLLLTTVYWSILGAHLQNQNADQLVDPYLFIHWQTFHQAIFPATHTFLLKWPIFWIIGLFGVTATTITIGTVLVTTVTVGCLAYILSRIERRPLVLGTELLGLTLALLLIPAQPYAGGILPVNMAMLATRNIEYIVYITAIALIAKAHRLLSWQIAGATALLLLLCASDRLFVSLSLGGSLLMLVAYALVRSWSHVTFATRWLLSSLLATVGSSALLLLISVLNITHFSNATSPYSVVSSVKDVLLGGLYALLGLLTNAGANPVYDNRVVAQLPAQLLHRLFSLSGLVHLIAAGSFIYAVILIIRFVLPTVRTVPRRLTKVSSAQALGLSLVASSVIAIASFIFSKHYYAVDARYLTIGLFTLSIATAVSVRRRRWQKPGRLVMLGGVFAISIIAACCVAFSTMAHQAEALRAISSRNQTIAQALHHHKVSVLIGDYWRVLPIRLATKGSQTVLPLTGCTQPAEALTSKRWQPDLKTHSFAYLLSFDASLTNYPACNLATIIQAYGHPNATETIAGSLAYPTEVLLFYDHGSRVSSLSVAPATNKASLLPIVPDQLQGASCSEPTIMTIVAHQDDDLLFTSPDLLHDIRAGHCMRTVYLTAGDSGQDRFYWLSRQIGAEAAYSQMLSDTSGWIQKTLQLNDHEFVTVASPLDNNKISLVFFNLPDGNLQGQGFASSGDQSLAKLVAGVIVSMRTVDGQSTYTLVQLQHALAELMSIYQPTEIRSQADVASVLYPDHSDHIATGKIAATAAAQYSQQKFEGKLAIPFVTYIGYPIRGYPANVFGGNLSEKEAAFLAYAKYDGGVCRNIEQCAQTPTYGSYLSRQYQQTP